MRVTAPSTWPWLDHPVSGLFKWRQFEPEVILLAVGWYLRFSLSYRDVEELLAERGVHADHVAVWRSSSALRSGNGTTFALGDSNHPTIAGVWTLTYVRLKGKWVYLYRVVDSGSATIDFLLWR